MSGPDAIFHGNRVVARFAGQLCDAYDLVICLRESTCSCSRLHHGQWAATAKHGGPSPRDMHDHGASGGPVPRDRPFGEICRPKQPWVAICPCVGALSARSAIFASAPSAASAQLKRLWRLVRTVGVAARGHPYRDRGDTTAVGVGKSHRPVRSAQDVLSASRSIMLFLLAFLWSNSRKYNLHAR